MSTTVLDAPRWSRRHWAYAIASVAVVQVLLIYLLAQPEQRPPERPIFRTAIQLAADEESAHRIMGLPGLDDPTLLALPSLEGFSGAAWLSFPTLDYKPAEWSEPEHWLPLDTQSLAGAFVQFVATNEVAPPLIADKPLPSPARYEPNFPNEMVPTNSIVHLDGALAGRELTSRIDLPSWAASDILSNTVVQSAVDAEGSTFSALLLSSSGSTNADRRALSEVMNARFRPVRDRAGLSGLTLALTWGQWTFHWHTLPLPATNLAAIGP